MNEHKPDDNESEVDPNDHETASEPQPRIYVASLADYNDGRLYGAWIDAAQDESELVEAIQQMLANSPTPGAEEWAIHDYEYFGLLELSEFESLESVSNLAKGIVDYGPAFAAWAQDVGRDFAQPDDFEDAYMGEWKSGKDFAREMLDDMGLLAEVTAKLPAHLIPYVRIDYEGFFEDLVLNGDISSLESPDGTVYIFRN